MVGVSVVQYNMNILQQSTKTNSQQRDVLIIRKPSQGKECNEDVLGARRKAKCGKETPNPPPIAVARRNARERNRVKQVNNGFANLRQHIPNSIAASFESNTGRGGNKKLSKVETLRMAVEYIRSLEDILASSDNERTSSNFISYPSPSTPSSPALTTSTNLSYNYPIKSPPEDDDDDLSLNSTPSSPQYIRIDNGNAYQIIDTHLYENGENLEPLDQHLVADPSLIHADLEFGDVQDLSLLNSIHSPDIYSESSCSPGLNEKSGAQTFVPMIHGRDGTPPSDDVKFEPVDVKDVVHPVISLHTTMQISQDHKENMLHVMAWWEQQQNSSS